MDQISVDDDYDGYPICEDFSIAIQKTDFVEDYCTNDNGNIDSEIVDEINRLFNEYRDADGWDKRLRRGAGSHATAQLERLHEAFEKFYSEWEHTCENRHAGRQIMDAYCGPPQVENQEYDQRLQELSELRQVSKLRNSIKIASQTASLQLDGLLAFGPGRAKSPHLDRLIRQLSNLVSRVIRKARAARGESDSQNAEEQYECVSELLKVIDIAMSSKTLRNKNPLSRYYIPKMP